MPENSLSKLLCLFTLISLFLTATCRADAELSEVNHPPVILNAETYGVSEGLSQSTVTSVAEDDEGYIWIGTLNGLNRFDGKEFKQFYANDGTGLNSSFIQSLLFYKGVLYVGTDEGFYTYKKDSINFERNNATNGAIWSFSLSESNDYLYIGSSNGFYKYDIYSRKIEIEFQKKDFNSIKKIIENQDDYIVRNHDGSVYLISKSTKKTVKVAEDTLDIYSFSNSFWYTKKNGIYNINKNKKILGIEITSSNKDGNSLTVLNNEGIFQTNIEKNEVFNIGELPARIKYDSRIYNTDKYILIYSDNNGILLIRKNKNLVKKIKSSESPVWYISAIEQDNFLVSDESEWLIEYDKNINIIKKYNTQTKGIKFSTKVNNYIFFANKSGFYKLSQNNGEIKEIIAKNFTSMYSQKNYIYLTTTDGEIYEINCDSDEYNKIFNLDDKNNSILQIGSISSGKILLATQKGLLKIINERREYVFKGDIVYSIKKDNIGNYYFGTSNAIYLYDGNSVKKELATNNPIYSISATNGDVIASSLQKVYIKLNGIYSVLNREFGSQDEYNSQSAIHINDTYIFGGMNGLSIIKKSELNSIKKSLSLKTNLNELLIFNKPISNKKNQNIYKNFINNLDIKLKYSDYPFTVKFNSPQSGLIKLHYFYRLKELSNDWLESRGTDGATYTNLPAQKYNLEVYAINPITMENGPITRLKIDITPPWWLSKSAKAAYILLVSLIFFIIFKAFLRRRETQRQIALSEERLKLSLWGSGDEMWDWDIESGKIFRSNIWGALEFPRDGQRSGKEGEESNIHPQDQERVREALNKHFYGETDHFEATYRVKSKTGEWLWILDRAKIVERDDKDHATRMTGTIKNISSFKTAEEQLRLFERAIENISEGVFILDTEFQFVELNEAACDITRSTREKTIGTTIHFSRYSDDYNKQIKQLLRQQGQWNTEIEAIRGDNSIFLMELTIDAIYDEQGILTHYVGVFSDISHRKQQEEELRRLTNNDLLTGLPNRSNLQVTLENLVKKDHHHTLMILDLDNFKKINDSLGHQVGDELLCLVASRIANIIPKHTSLYRLGGDEFAILVDKNPDIGSSALIANDVIEAFNEPFIIADESLVVGVSIGIVLYPEDEQNEQALLRKADIAMYHAKSAGGNRYQFYSESLNRNALRQLEVESLIREGLKDDLFEVYFQPKISLRTGKLAGMEALVRLNHPLHGMIPPGEFIPLAEETGLIVEIGDLVLKKACFAAQKWREKNLFSGRVAVNLSSRQFALPDLQTRIESILRLTRLPAANLELEITEGTVIKQPEKAIKVMQQLTRMGISLALDDFGTGYSSLSYLKRFPIHTLKIDKAFVDDIDKSDRDLKMVDSIITIAHNMGLSVVGEGVEQTAQLNILRALNCEEIQGFIYSKAISESDFTEYLRLDSIEAADQQNGTN